MCFFSATYQLQANKGFVVHVNSKQKGTVRTNCIDCLDRTGVAQSVFARSVLARQMTGLGLMEESKHNANLLSSGDDVTGPEFSAHMEAVLKRIWADNADALSMQYAGTGALKSDYTRTGKRTTAGALEDLQKSLTRYFKNNFLDGFQQDALDLFLGFYTPTIDIPSPFSDDSAPHIKRASAQASIKLEPPRKSLSTLLLTLALACLIFLGLWGMLAPRHLAPHVGAKLTTQILLFFCVFATVAIAFLNKKGTGYATRPKLRQHATLFNANLVKR
jgi:hypothetical protein